MYIYMYIIYVTKVLVAIEVGFCNVFLVFIRPRKLYETS